MTRTNNFICWAATMLILLFSGSCNSTSQTIEEPPRARHLKVEDAAADTAIQEKKATEIDSASITTDNETLNVYLDLLQISWKDVPNPLTAVYKGVEIDDYPHIIFTDEKGDEYDFGEGNNELGTYENDMLAKNSQYIGKRFIIHWEWKVSQFNCCEGQMDLVTARIPSIQKITLAAEEKK